MERKGTRSTVSNFSFSGTLYSVKRTVLEQCTSTQMCSLTIAYSNEQGLLTMNTSDRKFQLPAVLVYLSANFLISFADKTTLLCVHENKGSCT